MTRAAWRKSSYSGNTGDNCVEVAVWRKSSYSSNTGSNCVEVAAWRTSSYSGNSGGNCVEVASRASVVAVRDSKDQDGPALAFGPVAWREFTRRVKNGAQPA